MKPRQLRALLRLLREHGVTDYAAEGVTLRLGPKPIEVVTRRPPALPPSATPEDVRIERRERLMDEVMPPGDA